MNLLFGTRIGDVNCGMRGLTKAAFERMRLKADGMEFATEMIVKASLLDMRICEVPCDLYKDLRDRPPHLRRWRDGWHHLRFMLLYSPTATFIIPGIGFLAIGALGLLGVSARDLFAPAAATWLGSRHIVTSLLFWLIGTNVLSLGVVAQQAHFQEHFDTRNRVGKFLHRAFSLDKGLILGVSLILIGLLALLYFPFSFYAHVFPMGPQAARLDCAVLAIASLLTGIQCLFASFALGLFYQRIK